jgi:hypothetical protein
VTSMATSDASPTSDDDASSLLLALRILTADRRALTGWISAFESPEQIEKIAARSYWHPNGFAKLVLQAGPEHKIRLHIWPPGENRAGESNPHGHRWNFASTVLCGAGLLETRYEESDGGESYGCYRYVGTAAGGVLKHFADVQLSQVSDCEIGTSERYMVDTSVVHTVRPLGTSLVATFVVQGEARLGSAPVYCKPWVAVDEPTRSISAPDVRALIREVLAALRQSQRGDVPGAIAGQ